MSNFEPRKSQHPRDGAGRWALDFSFMNLGFTSTEVFFRNGSGGISRDPFELAGGDFSLNPAGVCSVLQLGAMVPPMSPWLGVERIVPRGLRGVGDAVDEKSSGSRNAERAGDALEDAVAILIERLDGVLARIEKPVLLFSGGMDSSLIAARLAAAGRDDAVLFHFSFDRDDEETVVARAMAEHFGLRLEICMASDREQLGCLDEPGRIYPMPFADESTAPMFTLARAVVSRFQGEGVTVIDGTGGDGAFGMGAKVRSWEKILRIPGVAREVLAWPYCGTGAWLSRGKLEYWSRLMRRSCEPSPWVACIAQNPLAGVLYAGDYTQEICVALDEWVGGEVENDVRRAMVVADLGLTCANIFAQKDASILRGAGLGVVFPYLDGAIASLGLATLDADFSVKPKEILRVALRRQAPAKLVERPKSGFVDPEKGVFFSEAFLEFLSAAMEDSAPIAGLLVKKNVVKARDCLVRGMALPQQTLNCLWAIVFTDRWYRTARGASRQ